MINFDLFVLQAPEKYKLPLPMVTILSSGRLWPGKMNCVKEFMLVPKPGMPATEVTHLGLDTYKKYKTKLTSWLNLCLNLPNSNNGFIHIIARD